MIIVGDIGVKNGADLRGTILPKLTLRLSPC
jgi:hypothetical protein